MPLNFAPPEHRLQSVPRPMLLLLLPGLLQLMNCILTMRLRKRTAPVCAPPTTLSRVLAPSPASGGSLGTRGPPRKTSKAASASAESNRPIRASARRRHAHPLRVSMRVKRYSTPPAALQMSPRESRTASWMRPAPLRQGETHTAATDKSLPSWIVLRHHGYKRTQDGTMTSVCTRQTSQHQRQRHSQRQRQEQNGQPQT